jgi:hypothetical protein
MKPLSATERKERPIYSGVLRYFPLALMEVARTSYLGNEQHNPGEPMRWDRGKSTDEADALVRHLLQAGDFDTDGVRHTAKVAWRALALLEKELEQAGDVPERELLTQKRTTICLTTPNGNAPVQESPASITNEQPRRTYDERRAEAGPCPFCDRKHVTHPGSCKNATECVFGHFRR